MLVIVLLYVRRIFFISLCVPVLSVFFSRCFFLSFLLFLLTFLRCISRSLFHCPSFFFFWYSIFKSFLFSLVSLKKKKKIPKIIFQRVGGGEKIGFPEHGNFSNLDRNLGRWRGRKLDGLFPITFGIRVFDICPRKWLKLDPLK